MTVEGVVVGEQDAEAEGEGHQEQGNLGSDVGRTWRLAETIVPGFLMAGLVGYLMVNCEMNDLVHAPGILGLCKVKGWLEALQPAGRCRLCSSGCGAPEHPALGQRCRSLPPILRDLRLELCIRAQDDKTGNRTQSRCS